MTNEMEMHEKNPDNKKPELLTRLSEMNGRTIEKVRFLGDSEEICIEFDDNTYAVIFAHTSYNVVDSGIGDGDITQLFLSTNEIKQEKDNIIKRTIEQNNPHSPKMLTNVCNAFHGMPEGPLGNVKVGSAVCTRDCKLFIKNEDGHIFCKE